MTYKNHDNVGKWHKSAVCWWFIMVYTTHVMVNLRRWFNTTSVWFTWSIRESSINGPTAPHESSSGQAWSAKPFSFRNLETSKSHMWKPFGVLRGTSLVPFQAASSEIIIASPAVPCFSTKTANGTEPSCGRSLILATSLQIQEPGSKHGTGRSIR